MDLVIRCAHLPVSLVKRSSPNHPLEIPGGKGANQAVAAARLGGEVDDDRTSRR